MPCEARDLRTCWCCWSSLTLCLHTAQALYVLEAMHNNGLRHRDIRPDNLLFCNGKVMVIDFAFCCGMEPEL